MSEDVVEGTSGCGPTASGVPRGQRRHPWPVGFADMNGDEGRIEADLTVIHTGEERVTASVEACLAEAEPVREAAELRSSELMVKLIGVCSIVDIWRLEEKPAG